MIGVALGERESFSGKIRIAALYRYTGVKSRPLNVNVMIGTYLESYHAGAPTRPFLIAMVEKTLVQNRAGYDFQNFPDGCP